ncbi:MAG: DUF1566 domain-containing protein [Polyangiaceae bacterium]
MRRKNVILMSLAIVLPLATAIDVKPVKGSEPPGRLVNNGDGTVTDTVTNLVWQQAGTNLVTNQATAVTTCSGLSLGAFTSGWRVPAIKELVSIVDYESATAPMIDTAAFPNTEASTSEPYWTTSTTLCVAFANGEVTTSECTDNNPVRCVHTGT